MPSSITLVKWKIGVEEYVHKETREIHHVCEKANESKDLNVKNFGVKQDFDQKILKINVIGPTHRLCKNVRSFGTNSKGKPYLLVVMAPTI
jgi:hypothetical protein